MTDSIIDVAIIGAGPAGIQAAIHASRKKIRVVILGRPENSAIHGAHVENYACVGGVVNGADLLETGLAQSKKFGAETIPEDVLKIEGKDGLFTIYLESGRTLVTRTIIFAIGVSKKKLKIPNEKEFTGQGVSYCVDCDANFYRGATVAVVGNQSAAIDGALTLLDYADKVYLISKKLNASKELLERLHASHIELIEPSWVQGINGEQTVTSISLKDNISLVVEGVFIELGAKGAIELATQVGVSLDTEQFKFIETNRRMETNIKGIYAAGDITGSPFQMAKAVGEGCIAGMAAAVYARKQKNKEKLL
jgi:thioredoxin reductase (NADPH)